MRRDQVNAFALPLLHRFRRDASGGVAMLFALALPALLGATGVLALVAMIVAAIGYARIRARLPAS